MPTPSAVVGDHVCRGWRFGPAAAPSRGHRGTSTDVQGIGPARAACRGIVAKRRGQGKKKGTSSAHAVVSDSECSTPLASSLSLGDGRADEPGIPSVGFRGSPSQAAGGASITMPTPGPAPAPGRGCAGRAHSAPRVPVHGVPWRPRGITARATERGPRWAHHACRPTAAGPSGDCPTRAGRRAALRPRAREVPSSRTHP
jgi:hypothetical protein